MEITGFVRTVLEMQTGSKQDGSTWQKRDFVVEIEGGQFPKILCITAFGKNADSVPRVGDSVRADVNVESKLYKDKYFTNVTLWKYDIIQNGDNGYTAQTISSPKSDIVESADEPEVELPF